MRILPRWLPDLIDALIHSAKVWMWVMLFAAAFVAHIAREQHALLIEARATITQQTTALELWAHCPLPTSGTLLVIEADWPDKAPGDTYRCSVAKKRLPGKLGQPLPRRDS